MTVKQNEKDSGMHLAAAMTCAGQVICNQVMLSQLEHVTCASVLRAGIGYQQYGVVYLTPVS